MGSTDTDTCQQQQMTKSFKTSASYKSRDAEYDALLSGVGLVCLSLHQSRLLLSYWDTSLGLCITV